MGVGNGGGRARFVGKDVALRGKEGQSGDVDG